METPQELYLGNLKEIIVSITLSSLPGAPLQGSPGGGPLWGAPGVRAGEPPAAALGALRPVEPGGWGFEASRLGLVSA